MADIHVFFSKSENKAEVYELLNTAVEKVFGLVQPKLIKDENGKPYFTELQDIHFSLSHSGEYVMCALSKDPIGADIQKHQAISQKTAQRVFTERELENADSLSLWCLKESFIKLRGKIDRPYREMTFIKIGEEYTGPDGAWGKVLTEIPGYAAAICSETVKNVMVSML